MTTSKRKPRAKAKPKENEVAEEVAVEEVPLTECQQKGSNCHWTIAPPNGPVSMGICKKCGAEKEFRNSFEYSSWYGAKSTGGRGRGRPRKNPS